MIDMSANDVADLFLFLVETTEARQSVVRRDDLNEIIMCPVDVGKIKDIYMWLKN